MSRICFALLITTVMGCSSNPVFVEPEPTPVTIMVTINGEPLTKATVTLSPTGPNYGANSVASGVTDDKGIASLKCNEKSGACPGVNRVTISEGPLPDALQSRNPDDQNKAGEYLATLKNRPIPEKFQSVAQSPLTLDIKKDQADYKLELTREATPEAPKPETKVEPKSETKTETSKPK